MESRQQAVLEMNEVISNSLGLYRTGVEQADGSTIYYYHNGSTLDNSNIIYTYRAGGFAWTDAWDGEDTVWQYGITKDGNAVLNMLSAYKISTDMLSAGCVTTEKLETSFIESIDDRFELVVKTSSSGSYSVNSAGIVAAINASGSTVQIHADKIYLNGQTIADAITAGSIVTGAIDVTNALGYSLLYASTYDHSMQIGGFTVSRGAAKGYIALGKSAYNDSNSGVYLGTDGIGLGSQTFYVTSAGYLHAQNANITGSTFTGTLKSGTVLVSGITLGAFVNPGFEGYGLLQTTNDASGAYHNIVVMNASQMLVGREMPGDRINGMSVTAGGTYLYGYAGETSDLRAKKDISEVDDRYSVFFDSLKPRLFKYIDGDSGRTWTGFIAQEIKAALETAGLTTQEFAGIVIPPEDQYNQNWSLRYDLFIALCVNEIQKLKKIIKERIA